jgi:hypothetical protein
MQTNGSPLLSRKMASTGQAVAQSPQRMHRFFFTMTPPPGRWEKAPVGQTAAQGAGRQARQCWAINPVDSPPEEWILMPAVCHDIFLCTSLAQASEQEWQPMQRSILGVVSIFIYDLCNVFKKLTTEPTEITDCVHKFFSVISVRSVVKIQLFRPERSVIISMR